MTDRIRMALGDLKARQDACEHMPCPRCGRNTMKENIYTNALSRHADIYICDYCGTEEVSPTRPRSSKICPPPKRCRPAT